MIQTMTEVLSSAEIDYVKWDMNRIFSDIYSRYLPEDRQGEVTHRYVLGLYRLMDALTTQFPEILWEGCSAGGNRFDLGALCYFPQIWGSDNTDAISRLDIQNGYSYGYPQSTYTSHVSACPNHQTLRVTPLETRANVAFFGNLGYECNLCDMSKEECEAIAVQVGIYKKYRKTLQFGDFYRTSESYASGNHASDMGRALGLMSPAAGQGCSDNVVTWTIVNEDQTTAVGLIAEKEHHPNDPHLTYVARGLNPDKRYHFSNIPSKVNVKTFGDLVNAVGLPIHVKQDSLIHNLIAKFYSLDGEVEDTICYGDTLMEAGKPLTQGYIGTGITNVRIFKDFASRIYFMSEE
jgi:alpha-galactosidase